MPLLIPTFEKYFLKTDAGQQAVKMAEAEARSEREEKLAERQRILKAQEQHAAEFVPQIDTATEAYNVAQAALQAAHREVMRIKSAASSAAHVLERERVIVERWLAENCPTELRDLETSIEAKLGKLPDTMANRQQMALALIAARQEASALKLDWTDTMKAVAKIRKRLALPEMAAA